MNVAMSLTAATSYNPATAKNRAVGMELSTSHQTHSESDSILYASPTLPTPDGHPLAGLKKIHSVPYGADRLSCQTQVPGRGVAKRQWKAAALKIKVFRDNCLDC